MADQDPSGIVSGLEGRRILIVEDEFLVSTEISLTLEEAGAEVIGPAGTVDEGLSLTTEENRLDGAILDVDLHGKDVYPVAERLAAISIPFIFHTGHGGRAELNKRFPTATVCPKPTLPEMLMAALLERLKKG
ncbi:MAG: response regulator [Pseudomonadota bacterium]